MSRERHWYEDHGELCAFARAISTSFDWDDRDDFDAWPAFLGLIDSTVSGSTPKALDIYHPDLVEQGISSVVKDTSFGTEHDGLDAAPPLRESVEVDGRVHPLGGGRASRRGQGPPRRGRQ